MSDQFPGQPFRPESDAGLALSGRKSVLTVSELNRRTRGLIEAHLELTWVAGELSNVVRAASGHWYFVLKDATAQVRCVMFRNKAALVGFQPENGMQVEVHALPSLYEARGEFQLGVETLRRAGLGALFEAFLKLKAKLESEGLFDPGRKRELPRFPKRLGVITSLKAAALRDVLTTLRRRAPMIEVIIYPTSVQGATAAPEIVAALQTAAKRMECDALILCRGGGSIEDLWSFNEEAVARAIAACPLPVVSGVGHETDFTIADFVADHRAPTPTAAAELLSTNRNELLALLQQSRTQLQRSRQRRMELAAQRLDQARRGLLAPDERIRQARERIRDLQAVLRRMAATRLSEQRWALSHASERLRSRAPDLATLRSNLANIRRALDQRLSERMSRARADLDQHRAGLALLNPQRTLERGYAIATTADGAILRNIQLVRKGDALRVRLAQGVLETSVTDSKPDA